MMKKNSIPGKTIISTLFLAISFCVHSQSGTEIVASADVFENRTYQNVPIEFVFTTETEYEDPFNTVDLDLVVIDPDGFSQRVPAFWAGGNIWKVRY